jgi:hypothetical protein
MHQFDGLFLPLFNQPSFGRPAGGGDKMPFQRPHGDVAAFRQFCHGPLGLPGARLPVLNLVQFMVHIGRIVAIGALSFLGKKTVASKGIRSLRPNLSKYFPFSANFLEIQPDTPWLKLNRHTNIRCGIFVHREFS